MEHAKKIGKILLNLLVYLFVLGIIFLLPWLCRFFYPLLIGWILSMLANPLAKFMEKHLKIVRKYTSALIIILSIGLVVLLCYLLGLAVAKLVVSVADDAPAIYRELKAQLDGITDGSNKAFAMLPDAVEETVRNGIDSIGGAAADWVKGFLSTAVGIIGNAASNIPNIIIVVVFTILSAYFFIADKDKIIAWVRKVVPAGTSERYHFIVGQLKLAVGGYFKAQFKIMGIIFVILLIGFLIIRVPVGFAIIAAFLTALLDFMPFLGTGFVLGPWAIIAFFSGDYYMVVAMGVLYIICLIAHQVVQPKLIGDSIGLDPLRTLIFMWIGYKLGGVLGMIIGIPVGMILVNLYENGIFEGVRKTFRELIDEVKMLRKW